jgi:hypothetical protein
VSASRQVPRGNAQSEIQVMNADGTGVERLTDDAANDPAWSPA